MISANSSSNILDKLELPAPNTACVEPTTSVGTNSAKEGGLCDTDLARNTRDAAVSSEKEDKYPGKHNCRYRALNYTEMVELVAEHALDANARKLELPGLYFCRMLIISRSWVRARSK